MGHVPTPLGRLRLSSQQICGTCLVGWHVMLLIVDLNYGGEELNPSTKVTHKNYKATQQLPTLSITGIKIIKKEWGEK